VGGSEAKKFCGAELNQHKQSCMWQIVRSSPHNWLTQESGKEKHSEGLKIRKRRQKKIPEDKKR
jgi:hypothetical protein